MEVGAEAVGGEGEAVAEAGELNQILLIAMTATRRRRVRFFVHCVQH